MRYIGNICIGCGEAFKEDDDIVVCPECGTPQHRQCYEKENKCVASDKHGEDYQWQGVTVKDTETTEKRETIPCPGCGNLNPKDAEQCSVCGMKFTIFGKNIVKSLYEEEMKENNRTGNFPASDTDGYQPPFTLGQGEAFTEKEDEKASAEKTQEALIDAIQNEETASDGKVILPGPFPPNDEIGGVKSNTIGHFVNIGAMNYIAKFKKLESGKKISFNFAAFFFSPFWFFYRKLYKAGIIFMTVSMALSIIATPYFTEYLNAIGPLYSLSENATEQEILAALLPLENAMIPILIILAVLFAVNLIAGFTANRMYKNYVVKNASLAEKSGTTEKAILLIKKAGGISLTAVCLAFLAEQVISYLVSYIL
ncbi:MAG: RING finger protein [Acutalibacteraceae bacterium]